jgi:Zn-dependent protease with chaperone function
MELRPILVSTSLALLAVIATQCAGQTPPEFDKTNPQREVELGREAAREYERTHFLSRNPAYVERVRRIGTALVDALPQKPYTFEFKVSADPEFNAFCLPGGFMYVHEGLLAKLGDDDAVAFVMAHEIVHAAHRHWADRMGKMKGISILTPLVAVTSRSNIAAQVAANLRQLIYLRYSREDEADADKTGAELAWTAGFDPRGAVAALKVMANMEKSSNVPEYLRDHPRAADRLEKMTAEADELSTRTRPALRKTNVDLTTDPSPIVGTLPDVAAGANQWFPLEVGRSWTYEVRGAARASVTHRIVSVTQTKAGPVYRAESQIGRGAAVAYQLLTTPGEVWRRNRPAEQSSAWQLECLLDLPEGARVERGGATYTRLPSTPVTVPCGSFADVMCIRKQSADGAIELTFARGVGLVRRVNTVSGTTETLAAYRAPSSVSPSLR